MLEYLPSIGISNYENLIGFIKAFEQLEQHRKSLDANGLRYFLNASYHIFSNAAQPMLASDYGWAMFSESQDYLLDVVTQAVGGKVFWKDARNVGLGFWISNPITLKQTFEAIARNQYWGPDGVHDPVACSLFYIALRKKNVLLGLWKLANHHQEQPQMLKFLANDFEEEKWQNAALKNAFALLGKQRYGIYAN